MQITAFDEGTAGAAGGSDQAEVHDG